MLEVERAEDVHRSLVNVYVEHEGDANLKMTDVFLQHDNCIVML